MHKVTGLPPEFTAAQNDQPYSAMETAFRARALAGMSFHLKDRTAYIKAEVENPGGLEGSGPSLKLRLAISGGVREGPDSRRKVNNFVCE